MIVNRNIGKLNIDIDINEGSGIYFDEEYASKLKSDNMSDILEMIYNESNQGHMPLSLFIELTNNCNFNCEFCYVNEKNQQKHTIPSFNELKDVLDYFVGQGLLYCTLSGGECLTYKDFEKLYKYLKEKGVLISVFTNGYLINDSLLSLLKKYKPFKIEISIYGIDDISYMETVGLKVDSERIFSIIKSLQNNNINVICKTPITKFTENTYQDIENWCLNNNIPFYSGIELIDGYSGDSKQMYRASSKVIDYEINKERDKLLEISKNFGVSEYKVKYNFDCTAGKTDIFINSNFELFPCMKAINRSEWRFCIKELGVERAYKLLSNKIEEEKKHKIKGCTGCVHNGVCEKCYFTQFEDTQEKVKDYCSKLEEFYRHL